MRFTAYDIYEIIDGAIKIFEPDKERLFQKLNAYPKVEDDGNVYAPIYMHKSGEYILGTLAQSYYTVLTTFAPETDTKKEVELDDKVINDKTYFYINCREKRIYIQGKRYPVSLNKGYTRDRIRMILEDCLGYNISFVQARIEYTIEDIEEIFVSSIVKSISFRHLDGLMIPKGTKLHNPKKELDDALIESYNTYSAPTLSSMDLKAKDGEKLSKNPLAKIGMVLSKQNKHEKIFRNMEIIEDGQLTEIKQGGNEHKVIYVPKKDQDDSFETYDRIMKKVSKNYNGRLEE